MTDATNPPSLRLRYAAVSDVGRHRKENQDAGYASENLLVVADGVGGAAYGDVASATAVELLRRLDRPDVEELLTALAGGVHRVHDRLAEMVEQDAALDGTSTTVTAALFDGHRLGFVHVGDSRAYLLRGGQVHQLTKDHTFVQTLVDEGRISEADSRVHPQRNIILRAVDAVHETEPDLFHVEPQVGDRVLLCSDGCSGALTDDRIEEILREGSVDSAALQLVSAALDAGSTDNVTVVVAELVPADAVDSLDTSAAAVTGPMLVGAAASQPRRGGMLSRAAARHRRTDTDELDPVPGDVTADLTGDPTADQAVDPEELRYAPRPPRRRGRLRLLVFVALPLLLLAGLLAGGYAWSQQQYFVAADGPYVAIYRGVQLDLPGIELARSYEVGDIRVDALPPFNQGQVEDGIVADDYAHAQRIMEGLREQAAEECPPTGSGDSPSASPSPGTTPTGTPAPSEPAPGRTSEAADRIATSTASPPAGPTTDPTPGPTADPTSPTTGPTTGPLSGTADDCADAGATP